MFSNRLRVSGTGGCLRRFLRRYLAGPDAFGVGDKTSANGRVGLGGVSVVVGIQTGCQRVYSRVRPCCCDAEALGSGSARGLSAEIDVRCLRRWQVGAGAPRDVLAARKSNGRAALAPRARLGVAR